MGGRYHFHGKVIVCDNTPLRSTISTLQTVFDVIKGPSLFSFAVLWFTVARSPQAFLHGQLYQKPRPPGDPSRPANIFFTAGFMATMQLHLSLFYEKKIYINTYSYAPVQQIIFSTIYTWRSRVMKSSHMSLHKSPLRSSRKSRNLPLFIFQANQLHGSKVSSTGKPKTFHWRGFMDVSYGQPVPVQKIKTLPA